MRRYGFTSVRPAASGLVSRVAVSRVVVVVVVVDRVRFQTQKV